MNKRMALLFAIIGTVLLGLVGVALSSRNLAWTGAAALAAITFIGSGFVVKAKMRRARSLHDQTSAPDSPASAKHFDTRDHEPMD